MKFLTDEYWGKFKKDGTFNGDCFEIFIGILLRLHTKKKWTKTQKTRDGGKDFVLNAEGKTTWAECKAHKNHISLDIIGPTLIMATINNVNHIIFFSYSKLTSGVKENLARYGKNTDKTIEIVDDEVLERLILHYFHIKPIKRFFPNVGDELLADAKKQLSEDTNGSKISVSCKMSKDPDILEAQASGALSHLSEDFSVNIFDTFAIDVFLENKSILSSASAEVALDENLLCAENYRLAVLNKEFVLPERKTEYRFDIPPCGTAMIRFYVQAITRAEPFVFQGLSIHEQGETTILELPRIDVKSIGTAIQLVGGPLQDFVDNKIPTFLNYRDHVTFLCIHGESGTGKSRLLEEVCNKFYSFGFRVHRFDGESDENSSFDSFIRRLYAKLASLPFHKEFICEDNGLNEEDKNEPLYRLIYNKQINISKDFDGFVNFAVEKLTTQKVAIVIDNVQHFDDDTIRFLRRVYDLTYEMGGRGNLTLCFNTTFMIKGSSAGLLLNTLLIPRPGKDCESFEVKGFRDDEVKLYIEQLLKFEKDGCYHSINSLYPETVNLILEKTAKISGNDSSRSYYSPLYLAQMLQMFDDQSIIRLHPVIGYYFCSPEKLNQAVRELPNSLRLLFDSRWKNFLIRYKDNKDKLETIIIILAFMIHAPRAQFSLFFSEYENEIDQLETSGIVSTNISDNLVFYHRQLYSFFDAKYCSEYTEYADLIARFIESTDNQLSTLFYQYFISMALMSKIDSEILTHACRSVESASVFNESFIKFLPCLYDELFGFEKRDDRIDIGYRIRSIRNTCEQISCKIGFTAAHAKYKKVFSDIRQNHGNISDYGLDTSTLLICLANSYLPLYKDAEGKEVLCWAEENIDDFGFASERDKAIGLAQILNRLCVIHKSLNDSDSARSVGERALSIAREYGDKYLELKCLIDLGNTYEGKIFDDDSRTMLLKYWTQAVDLYEEARSTDRQVNGSRPMVMLYKLQVLLLIGNYDEYQKLYSSEVKYCEKQQIYFFMMKMMVLNIIAEMVYETKPDYEGLYYEAHQVKDLCLAYNANRSYWNTFYVLAKISMYLGKTDEMKSYYLESLNRLNETAGNADIISFHDDLIHEIIIDFKLNGITADYDEIINLLPVADRSGFFRLSRMDQSQIKEYLKSGKKAWSTFTLNGRNLPNP